MINVTSFGGSMALRWFENTRQGEARRKNNNISHYWLPHLQMINVTSFGGSMSLHLFEKARQGEARRKNNNISKYSLHFHVQGVNILAR
jgi:hypothetical protein